jgi:thiamine transporter
MAKPKNPKLLKLTESAIMLALSIALGFVTIIEMPMGGEVTLLSMLPICLLSIKYDLKTSVPVAFLYAMFKLVKGIASGNVFVYCTTVLMVVICVAFDYIIPFTVLGFAGMFKKLRPKKFPELGMLLGIITVICIRFVCHYITGFAIWGQWAPEGQSKFIYSLIYNGQYMLPELIITTVAAEILIRIPAVKKLINAE